MQPWAFNATCTLVVAFAGACASSDPADSHFDATSASKAGMQSTGDGAPEAGMQSTGDGSPEAGNGIPVLDLKNCPEEPPTVGEPCEAPPLLCSYGESRVSGCRDYFECETTTWRVSSIPKLCVEIPGFCPEDRPEGSCSLPSGTEDSPACVQDDGAHCYCNGGSWHCHAPPAAGCPTQAPNFGDLCSTQGLACEYGDPCRGGASRICRLGAWQPVGIACPG